MSLNGLDNPAVIEAYQSALTEAGGWFLLHYVSRDEVALFDRGTGGVPEVRNTIDGYEEKSPLYGFLQYRRRKVLLSYMPEGLSRLIQARTTVQLQSVLDKFSPHDTVFSLTKSTDLTESALSSACLLHAASGSITSSSSSLRRRRLMEITEDAEENATGKDESQSQSPVTDNRRRSFSQLSDATLVPPRAASRTQQVSNIDETLPAAERPTDSQPTDPAPSMPSDLTSERPTSRKTFQDELSQPSYERRQSIQSARTSIRDLELVSYSPKVKLGPRPSVDTNGRPRTSGGLSRNQDQRPVASLPAGVRSSSLRKPNPSPNSPRPRSQGSSGTPMARRGAPPVPPLLVPPLSMPISRPQISPGAKSLSAVSGSTGVSNEKERLMKALQMRKKQMEKRAEGKKGQKSTEERPNTSVDANEHKENIGHSATKVKQDGIGHTATALDQEKEEKKSLNEIQPPPVCESIESSEEVNPISHSSSKLDSAVDLTICDSDGEQPSNTSLSSAAATESTDHNEPYETDQSLTPPITAHQPETDALEKDSAVSVTSSDTRSGPRSPSATVNVPLEEKAENVPEEIARPPPQTENPPVPGDQEADTVTDQPKPIPLVNTPSNVSQPSSVADPSTPTASNVPESEHDLTPEANQVVVVERKDKRKHYLEPIQVPTPEYSDDDNLLSDDSFMEELKSATFEEATSVSVGKSPLSPVYSANGNEQTASDAWRNSRAVSNPSAHGHQPPIMQTVSTNRSVSSPYGDLSGPATPVLVAKKINVSSGISKRIQALEKFSSRDPPPNSNNLTTPSASASFETFRKRASISLGGGNSESASRQPSFSSEALSRAPSLTRPNSQSSAYAAPTTNSVSVTARIVRDPNATTPNDTKSDPFDSSVLNLQASPLTVEHETTEVQDSPVESEPNQPQERSMSTSSAGSEHQSLAPTIPPRSESRMSVSSHSKGDVASSPEDKKESRASKLLRRMSSLTSNSRKSATASPTSAVKEDTVIQETASRPQTSQAIDIGEVNVQFPDTLLWKRRFVRVDDKGFLVLTPGNIDSSNRNMIKRYHLTEFRTPCLPDEDRQELPNSIVLDFLDGSTLQCACESRQGQTSVLQTLVQAHSAQQ